jgi:hypothetical protein
VGICDRTTLMARLDGWFLKRKPGGIFCWLRDVYLIRGRFHNQQQI